MRPPVGRQTPHPADRRAPTSQRGALRPPRGRDAPHPAGRSRSTLSPARPRGPEPTGDHRGKQAARALPPARPHRPGPPARRAARGALQPPVGRQAPRPADRRAPTSPRGASRPPRGRNAPRTEDPLAPTSQRGASLPPRGRNAPPVARRRASDGPARDRAARPPDLLRCADGRLSPPRPRERSAAPSVRASGAGARGRRAGDVLRRPLAERAQLGARRGFRGPQRAAGLVRGRTARRARGVSAPSRREDRTTEDVRPAVASQA